MQVQGERVERGRRVSFTFRRVLRSGVCFCSYPEHCESSQEQRDRRRAELRAIQVCDMP